MRIGFTGTRDGMSVAQKEQIRIFFGAFANRGYGPDCEFHHGGQRGADRDAHAIAESYLGLYQIHVHPCHGVVREFGTADDYWHEVFEPLKRNRLIVEAVDVLIAAPKTDREEFRSGTWATVRYARQKGIPVVMLSRGEKKQ